MPKPAHWHEQVFFGLHYDLHANAKDTELGAALTPEHLKAELEKVRPDWVQCDCKGHAGYTSWPTQVGTTSPGVVRDALRIHRDVTRELGIPLVVHYSGVWDSRAVELHPDWGRLGPDGKPTPHCNGGPTCDLGPYTRELMIPQLLEIIEHYDVDGFWVDGENWAAAPCYCPRCREAFTRETGISDIPAGPDQPHWRAWGDFHRRNFEEHVRAYTEAVHERQPSCLVCSNWMYTIGQPDEIRVPVDYLSGDFPWAWGPAAAALEGRFMDSRGLSWNLMAWGFGTGESGMGGWTFKPAAHLCQEAAVVISLGGAFQVYDQPQRNGHLTGWHQDTLAQVARFVRARQPWCQHTSSVPQVALLHSAHHLYSHNGGTLMTAGAGSRPLAGALQALLENHYPVDILSEQALLERMGDYPLVVVAEQTDLPPALRQALADYVRGGGRLLLSGVQVAADFGELVGAAPEGEARAGYFHLPVAGEATTVKGPWQPVRLAGARALLEAMSQQEPGSSSTGLPVVTLHAVGQGRVLAIHADLFDHFAATQYPRTRRLVGELLGELEPELWAELEAPARLHLVLRRQPGRLIAHLVNMGTAHPTSPKQSMVEEVPPVGPITLRLRSPQPPARVYLAPGREGLTWEWREGWVTASVQSVGILDSVVVEG